MTRRVVYAWKLIRSKAGSFAGITFGKSSTCCRVLTAARCEYNQTGPETGQIASSVPVMFCDVTICRAQWLVAGAADDHHLNLSRTWTRHLESNMAPLICQSNVTLSCLTHTSLALMGKSGMGGGGSLVESDLQGFMCENQVDKDGFRKFCAPFCHTLSTH